ncbi:GSCFA domain-containing protein [Chitinophagaceae bacterium LB-8]|uniref:GSCFA domain-containing protein n=1 Tax=Paraflavisolibacter caeni TaxID=2982496 RepID=A0A9X2XYA9_9BACT|nr:GSCFA domain-containing protein [Paraflavisolibacter caeni]MCU7550832.1 GSCFA domain-containing protein [Paraflavisolibacter caeni]
MEFMLNINLPKAEKLIHHQHHILSVGSCFTEHIGNALTNMKFQVLQNPNGILFDPVSVCSSLVSYIRNKQYSGEDLFYLNELWQSWQHHSRFSGMDKDRVLEKINRSQNHAHHFLKEADWLIITLGSAFNYRLKDDESRSVGIPQISVLTNGGAVANCHRAPSQFFQKNLLSITEIIENLDNTIHQLFHFNKKLNIIFTISPVRHIRDGVVENNRSKARLIEAVHHMVNKFNRLYYFPSYELVIDVLRDYRFYDIDMVHPNYPATEFVLQKFQQTFMSEETIALSEEVKKIVIACKHRSANPATEGHKKFLRSYLEKVENFKKLYPYMDFEKEIKYFSNVSDEG